MTLRQVAEQAYEIYATHEEAAHYDAGYDAGEFSGPSHARMADRKIKELAKEHGFTTEQVWDEMRLIYAEMTAEQHLEGHK